MSTTVRADQYSVVIKYSRRSIFISVNITLSLKLPISRDIQHWPISNSVADLYLKFVEGHFYHVLISNAVIEIIIFI